MSQQKDLNIFNNEDFSFIQKIHLPNSDLVLDKRFRYLCFKQNINYVSRNSKEVALEEDRENIKTLTVVNE